MALVRPDRYLFGGGTAAQVPALMQQLLAMLLVDSPTAVNADTEMSRIAGKTDRTSDVSS